VKGLTPEEIDLRTSLISLVELTKKGNVSWRVNKGVGNMKTYTLHINKSAQPFIEATRIDFSEKSGDDVVAGIFTLQIKNRERILFFLSSFMDHPRLKKADLYDDANALEMLIFDFCQQIVNLI